MKKSKCLLIIALSFCFCCAFFILPFVTTQKTYADVVDDATSSNGKINSQNCFSEYNMDISLFNILRELSCQIINEGYPIKEFSIDVFDYSSHSNPSTYYNASIDGEIILEDLQKGILDLSVGKYAKYDCIKNKNFSIKDIKGLNSLTLDGINTLILNGNALTKIDNQNLSSLFALKTLKVSNNKLTSFILNESLTYLNNLDLSNNNIKDIDVSKLVFSGGLAPSINLSGNEITDINNIILPNLSMSKLDISFNNIAEISQEDIEALNNKMTSGNKVNILLQGVVDFSKLYAGDKLTIYQGSEIENFRMKIYYSENSEYYNEEQDNLICESYGVEEKEIIYIPAGKIKIEFFSGETPINDITNLDASLLDKLSGNNLYNISIKNVAYKAYVNDKEVSSLSHDSNIKVVLDIENIDNIPNKNDLLSENGVKYFYYRNNQSKINSNIINITENGNFVYFAYLTFDGLNSDTIRLSISRRDLSSITWGIIIIVIIFVLCSAGYFVFKWFRDGAQVAPLSDKEIFRLNKRKNKVADKNLDDDFISSLDAPRHNTRVSDQGYSDNILEENLNEPEKNYDNQSYKKSDYNVGNFPDDIDNFND